MKKRPSFKVAAIESLETRELLSTTSFRPLQLRAAHSSAAAANQAVSVGSGTAGAALRAQGGPSATFNAQRYANLVAARAAHSQALHIARPNAARRNALQAPTLATTPAPVSSNPTKLAPSLPFTSSSSGTTTAGHPFVMNPGATSYRPSTSILSGPGVVVKPAVAGNVNAISITGPALATGSTAGTTSTTSTASTSTLSANSVSSYKVALDNFGSSYTSGANASIDNVAITSLNSSLALIGSIAWPINPSVTPSALSGFRTSVNNFVQSYTGGASPLVDSSALTGLSNALGLFSSASSTSAVTVTSSTGSTTTTVAPAASTSNIATTNTNMISPVITGLISGIVSSGTLSADNVNAMKNAVDNFAVGYTSGSNQSVDKVALTSLVNTLAGIAAAQWTKLIPTTATPVSTTTVTPTTTTTGVLSTAATSTATPVSTAATTTPTTATTVSSTATTTPTVTVSTPAASTSTTTTATNTPTVVVTSASASPTTATSTTATTSTASTSGSGVLFTAVRAPGV